MSASLDCFFLVQMIAHCIGSSSHSSHVARACVISLCVASDLFDTSIHFFSFLFISLITLFFLLPDNFNFHDAADKYPAHSWHPGRERSSHKLDTPWREHSNILREKCQTCSVDNAVRGALYCLLLDACCMLLLLQCSNHVLVAQLEPARVRW